MSWWFLVLGLLFAQIAKVKKTLFGAKVIVDVRKKHAVKSDGGHMSRELKIPD